METSTPTWRVLLAPAAFVLVTGVLLIAAWVSFGGGTPLSPEGYRVAVPVDNAANVVPGSDVQISGVNVGRVVAIERADPQPLVELELDSDQAPLASDARVIVRTKSLLGEGYLELAPGSAGAEPIPEGGALAASQVQNRVQLDEFLDSFDPQTRDGLRRLVGGLARAHRGREGDFSAALGRLAPASAGIADVLALADAQRDRLEQMIASGADVLTALSERQGALRAAVLAGERVFRATAERDTELAAAIRALPPFLAQLEGASTTIDDAAADLNSAMRELRAVAPLVAPALRQINHHSPAFERLFDELIPTAKAAEAGLPAIGRTAEASLPALRGIYPALRELNPSLALLSANAPELAGIMANLGSALNGTLLAAGNEPLPNAGATVILSNEALLGYKSRLASNRLNPYIKPGGLREVEKRGHLLSYDCGNLGNPQLVPVIGFGTPPCVEQGPWKLLGEKSYFPRLERADP